MIGLALSACTAMPSAAADNPSIAIQEFEAAVRERASELTIPGIAYAVIRDGKVLTTGEIALGEARLTPDTALRIASVTKAFTAVLLMRAVEAGKLSLDDPASKWLPEFRDRPAITIRHLAAHVSEGIPGTEYVYATQRYAKLGDILRQVHGAPSFEAALRREIIERAGLSWHDSPGLGAHAALVSTVTDLARFAVALQRNTLLTARSFDLMTTPFVSPERQSLPAGVGFFTQEIRGERVVWSFGQDDPDYGSALLFMIPKRKLALVMLANTDELSNPFRLLMGNVRTSPFATAFLDAFVPELAHDVDPRDRYITDLLALVAAENVPEVISTFNEFVKSNPVPKRDDFGLHFIAGVLAPQLPREFVLTLDSTVVAAHPRNRWALLMSGGIQGNLGNPSLAVLRYQAILDLPNQESDGLHTLFRAWSYSGMAMALRNSDRERARQLVDLGLATGVTGGTQAGLLELKKSLAAP